ncbi:MAG: flagellar hook-basal body complex protein FliE [Pseudobdellovibrio sp.]
MDGLTISNANRFIEAGGTRSAQQIEQNFPKIEGTQETGQSFAATLKDAIGEVNELQKTADVKAQELATGRTDDIAGVMLAAEKADIALRTMVQVRNKIIDAYQEIMRMQV